MVEYVLYRLPNDGNDKNNLRLLLKITEKNNDDMLMEFYYEIVAKIGETMPANNGKKSDITDLLIFDIPNPINFILSIFNVNDPKVFESIKLKDDSSKYVMGRIIDEIENNNAKYENEEYKPIKKVVRNCKHGYTR